jgi:uncharacterized protein (TIRG00374 family)
MRIRCDNHSGPPFAARVSLSDSAVEGPRGQGDVSSAGRRVRPSQQRLPLAAAAKLALAAGLIGWLIASGRLELSRLASVSSSPELGVIALLLLGAMVIICVRWWWLLRIQHLREPLSRMVGLCWAGYFAGFVLPGAVGGDVAKSYLILRRRRQARARAFSTVLVDRFIGLYSFVLLGSLSILWLVGLNEVRPAARGMSAVTLILLSTMTLAAGAVLSWRSRNLLLRVLPTSWRIAWNESFDLYRRGVGPLFGCLRLSLVSSAFNIASFAVAALVLGDAIRFEVVLLVAPLVVLANSLPITPGGIGVGETVASTLFASFGAAYGAEIMVLVRILQMLLALPGVGVLLAPSPRDSEALPPSTDRVWEHR